ncbi:MAG: Ig-like domain-containing protein, partial [Candidatus Latescibacteria bacterium]|nr:Ig-like domain-containing protein [Candidatus Latescibacterota bacterium]
MFTRPKLVLWVLSALCVMGSASLVTDLAAQESGQTVQITPSQGKVLVGHTKQFEVSGKPAEDYTWDIIESGYAEDVTVGTIDATGLFTALSGGYVIIAAMEEDVVI